MIDGLSRRRFLSHLASLAGSLLVLTLNCASAQQDGNPRHIGLVLLARSPDDLEWQAFVKGLRDAGYSVGHDLIVDARYANGEYERLPEVVVDLVRQRVDVLIVDSTVATQLAQRATSTIPIVMTSIADPVGSGIVPSLAHPGGNVTGLSIMAPDLSAKRLQLLKEAVPRLTRVAVLWNENAAFQKPVIEEMKAASSALSIEPVFVGVRTVEDLSPAFDSFSRAHAQALYVMEDSFLFIHRATLVKLAAKARLPAIYTWARVVEEGGLMAFGPDYPDLFRRVAGYVDKILKGAKPAEMPIEQPTKFDLGVNLRTAKALGLAIPQSILVRADEVIR